ncbi:MAG: bifunctional precorrin-2 dehydrogenase/sirohydrochlorin ferrochelatase [Thermoanaerobaculia bacterium]
MSAPPLPLFLKVGGRSVVLVGAGNVAWWKLEALLASGADVTVVSPELRPEFESAPVTIVRRAFQESDLDGAWLAVAAAPPEVNRHVAEAGAARKIFVNAVDDPPHASAYAGSVLRRDGVTAVLVAISTAGEAPALSRLLREGLDELLPADVGTWNDAARALRRGWRDARVPIEKRRPLLLDALNRLYERARGTAEAAP